MLPVKMDDNYYVKNGTSKIEINSATEKKQKKIWMLKIKMQIKFNWLKYLRMQSEQRIMAYYWRASWKKTWWLLIVQCECTIQY